MKKKWLLLPALLGLLWLLPGCAFHTTDELYALPKLPEGYQNLQAKIEEVTGSGAEYSAPLWGTNTQPVQLQDLDGDGVLEAIAFFKVSGEEKPLRIYVFRQTEEGYEVGAVIEGDGAAIHSVAYENLNKSPAKELIVSWQSGSSNAAQTGSSLYTMEVYSIDRYEVNRLMSTSYTNYAIMDIDMDNQKEVLVLNLDTIEGNKSRLTCWNAEEDSLVDMGSVPMSAGITGLDTNGVKTGFLRGATPLPALFVTSYYGEGVVTDIFAWRNGAVENITLSGEVSSTTYRQKDKASPTDINDDTCLEVPVPQAQATGGAEELTVYTWYQYDLNGTAWPVYTTYHNFDDGWYFIFPEQWDGQVGVTQSSIVGEKTTVFSIRDGGERQSFLTIYKLTGPNRHMRSKLGARFTLASDDNTIYAAEFTKGGWECGLDEAGVRAQFNKTKTDWSTIL